MKIPNLPLLPLTDSNGYMSSPWKMHHTQLITALQTSLSDEGYKLPVQSQENVSALNNDKSKTALLYDIDAQTSKVNNQGTFRKVGTFDSLTQSEIDAVPTTEINNMWVHNKDTGDLLVGIGNTFKKVTYT